MVESHQTRMSSGRYMWPCMVDGENHGTGYLLGRYCNGLLWFISVNGPANVL